MRPAATIALTAAALVLVAGIKPAAADPDEPIPGSKLLIKGPGVVAKFLAKPVVAFGLPSAANDPTAVGGALVIVDEGATAGIDRYALPAAGWKALGDPPGSKGYKYKGAGTAADPCKVVLVKPTRIKGVCKGDGVTLTPPFGGDAAVVIRLGTEAKRYCAIVGGEETKNETGLLKRQDALAPSQCPAVCGDGIVDAGEPCDDGNAVAGDGCSPACQNEISGGIFVATSGDDLNPGTAVLPKATVTAGIAEAILQGYQQVYVATGTYTETRFDLADGVSLYGGFDASTWTPNAGVTTLQSTGPEAVHVANVNSPTSVENFTIAAADGTPADKSSYGIHVADSVGLTVRGCDVQAGAGASGASGADGTVAPSTPGGSNGMNGTCDGPNGLGGAAGDNTCTTPGTNPDGGKGGDGGAEGAANNGMSGDTSPGSAAGGPGGPACTANSIFCSGGPCTAGPGIIGTDGTDGADGAADGAGGDGQGSVVAGYWIGSSGEAGDDGSNGVGGGGGGGGGAQAGPCVDDGGGNGGGGGGAGGCGGGGGAGGGGGGGSFGVMAANSTLVIEDSTVTAGDGGAGGTGGAGRTGGAGGTSGVGAIACTAEVGAGGDGGLGGAGGDGRNGGGGGGGISYALYASGSVVTESGNTYSGGSGGSGGGGPGPAGSAGDSGTTFP